MDSLTSSYPLCSAGNTNGCPTASNIKQIPTELAIGMFPNPSNGKFTIETNASEKQTLQLFDLNGRLVLNQIINGTTEINASNLDNGIYTLTIKNSWSVINKKLVISK